MLSLNYNFITSGGAGSKGGRSLVFRYPALKRKCFLSGNFDLAEHWARRVQDKVPPLAVRQDGGRDLEGEKSSLSTEPKEVAIKKNAWLVYTNAGIL